ncbi:MAG: 2OG-Fe(II) oxygenase [Gammaproteobacteria bacterium]|nr:2OG-Fe(II) oxygenase [Gammaproteobacteria bacterium]
MSIGIETAGRPAPLILPTTEPVADFHPEPDDFCFCNSGKRFGGCCGSTDLVRPPPYGLFMFENFLDPKQARELTDYAEQCEGERLMVIDNIQSTPDNIVKVEDPRRITERVKLGARRKEIQAMMGRAFIDLAQRCVGAKLDWYELPDLMRYRQGGFYVRHADSQNKDEATNTWRKVIDRDLSMLIYLNDGYEGGELSFYKFNYQIRPRAGAAVLFPSDHRYLHQAETLKSGVRYALVSWASVQGVPKIASQPPQCAVPVEYKPGQ